MELIKNISIYGFFTLFEKGLGLILLPLFTFYLTTEDYGILANYQLLLAIVTLLILSGSHAALNIEFIKREYKSFRIFISSIFVNIFITTSFVFIFISLVRYSLHKLLGVPYLWLYLLPIMGCMGALTTLLLNYLQISKYPLKFGLVSASQLLLTIIISVVLIIKFDYNYSGRLWANLVGLVVVTILVFYFFYSKKLFTINIDYRYMKSVFLFGIPLLPNALGHLIINSSDRLFISNLISFEEAGVYQVGYTAGSLILIYSIMFFKGWTPFLYELLKKDEIESKTKVVKISIIFLISVLILILVLNIIIAPLIFNYLIDETFYDGIKYVFGVALSYFFWSIFQIFGNVLIFNKRNRIFFLLGFFNVSLNLLLNYFFINWLGAIGAVYATALSLFIFCIIISCYSHKHYPLPWGAGFRELFKFIRWQKN